MESLFLSAVVLALSAHGPASPAAPRYGEVLIAGVPHVRQKPDFCGEACVESYLRKLGKDLRQDDVFELSGVDPAEGRGCRTRDLARALREIGFDAGPVWHSVPAGSRQALENLFGKLHADLLEGVPSVVCTRYDARPGTTEHFRLVLGYDAESDEVIFHEPAEDDGAYRRMARSEFLDLWPLKYRTDRWTAIRLALRPRGELKPAPDRGRAGFAAAEFARHVRGLRKKLSRRGFTIVVEPPFVVIGNERPDVVRRRAANTVRWAVRRLRRAFFRKDPREIIDVWLFRDEASYRRHAKLLFDHEPTTPFGYYSRAERALIMNIATGGGTLVHEIVHPFIEADFPACPSWFNEGLGSLYEQSTDRDGRIRGLTNWRLDGLQKAIRAGALPSFRTLTATTSREFYDEDPGSNYAQARYLCYYLQEKGLLEDFYRRFRAAWKEDPTGYGTLRAVLGEEDMDTFQRRWEAWVLRLRFR